MKNLSSFVLYDFTNSAGFFWYFGSISFLSLCLICRISKIQVFLRIAVVLSTNVRDVKMNMRNTGGSKNVVATDWRTLPSSTSTNQSGELLK